MATALRIILGFIATIVFVVIIFSTFFTSPSYLHIPALDSSKEHLDMPTVSQVNFGEFNTLYSNSELDENIMTASGGVSDINLASTGRYLSSFRAIGETYTFSSDGFLLTQEGSGEIFIDTQTTPGKVFIYSLNTPLTLSLVSDDTREKYVDIHLTPHMYIEFQPSRGKYLKNADRIRIGTVFKLGYMGSIGVYGEGEENIKKYFESEDEFLPLISSYINKKDLDLQRLLEEFSAQDVSQIPGYDTIQRYIHLFVNDEKKIVFYKNIVLEGYLKLLTSQDVTSDLVSDVSQDLKTLESLDEGSYDELIELRVKIMKALYASDNQEHMIAKMLFASFGDDTISENIWDFPLYGFALFHAYDIDQIYSYELSRKFFDSFPEYVKNVSIEEDERDLRYDYFLYYLEKQLFYLLSTEAASQDINSVILTLENYIVLTQNDDNYSVTAKVSRLFVISQMLAKIDYFLRGEYFLPERTEDGVLLLKTENKIPVKDVIALQNNIKALYAIYDLDVKHLSAENSRDAGIMKDINSSRERVNEYFVALEDYEAYKTEYNTAKTSLLGLDTFSSGENNDLSLEKIQRYLSKFVGASSTGMKITIENNSYYHVEKFNVSGKEFSFNISGFPEYKMEYIYIDGKSRPIVYKLGKVEDDWSEKYKTAPEEERDNYDFSKFFLLTFFPKNDAEVEEYITQTTVQEDKTEVVFKKDILLGNPGEFTTLKSFLTVEYRDISLKKEGQNYNIFLENVEFNISLAKSSRGNETYKGLLKSEYVLNDSDHYFKSASIQIYRKHDDIKKEMLFDGKSIFIGGKIHISDMKKTLEQILAQSDFYSSVYSQLSAIQTVGNISLQYTVFNNKLSIKFDSSGKKYTILLRAGDALDIYQGSSKLTSGKVSVNEIGNYIK